MQYLIEHKYLLHCFKYFSFRYKEATVQRLYFIDGIYEGQIDKNVSSEPKMNGIGVFLNNQGDMFFGEFKAGLLDGEANILMANGSFYRGKFREGVFDGLGVFIQVDRDAYLLNFKKGQLSGCVTYFPKSAKEVFIMNYGNNILQQVLKRYRLSTEQGEETKYRVLKAVLENSQLNETLYTANDVHKIMKKVSTSHQTYVNSQLIGKEFLYCGSFNNELEFEGLGLLVDFETRKIRIGDWDKQILNGFGILIQTKYMFKGNFTKNQLDGEILITNLETSDYKLCLYENGILRSVIKEGKGNYPFIAFDNFSALEIAGELKKRPGSDFIKKTHNLSDLKTLGFDLMNMKIKIPKIEEFLSSRGFDLEESQIVIAIKDETARCHRSKSPLERRSYKSSLENGSILTYKEFDRAKSCTRTSSNEKITLK